MKLPGIDNQIHVPKYMLCSQHSQSNHVLASSPKIINGQISITSPLANWVFAITVYPPPGLFDHSTLDKLNDSFFFSNEPPLSFIVVGSFFADSSASSKGL